MENKLHSLDELFSMAKAESPSISYQQTETMFTAAAAAKAATGSAWTKFITRFKKPFIMIGISGIILSTALVFSALNPSVKTTTTRSHSTKITTVEKKTEQDNTSALPEEKEAVTLSPNPAAEAYEKAQANGTENEPINESTPVLPEAKKTTTVAKDSQQTTDNYFNYYVPEATTTFQKEVSFTITDSTTKEELNAIKAQAEAAGVAFDFKMNLLQKSMKRLKLEINNGKATSKISLSYSGPFSTEIGWELDENGKAIQFSEADDEE